MPIHPAYLLPLLPTAILLLATASTWRNRRGPLIVVGQAAFFTPCVLLLAPLSPLIAQATLPLLALITTWLAHAHAEWRLAPDFGQRGFGWPFTQTLKPTLHQAIGIWFGQGLLVFLLPPSVPYWFVAPPILIGCATAASAITCHLGLTSKLTHS